MRSFISLIFLSVFNLSCSSYPKYMDTVDYVDMNKFSGQWYVITGRFTPFERDVYNSIEHYSWNSEDSTVDIKFTYNRGGFEGKEISIPQSGRIFNHKTNAHWKVSPFWPLEFDFLVIALAEDYSWTAIGVPNQKFLWVMFKNYDPSKEQVQGAIDEVEALGYSTEDIVRVPNKY